MNAHQFKKLALSFAGAVEAPHFDRASFRVGGRIFATLKDNSEAMVQVKPIDKALDLIEAEPTQFFSYKGFTTKMGCVGVHLQHVDTKLVTALLSEAWVRLKPKPKPFKAKLREGEVAKVAIEGVL